MPSTERHSIAYQPGLDGLRALAVVAVLLFHAGVKWLPGGFLGVDVFFVISGYLITGILMRNPAGGIGDFYLRRVRRLYPALLAMLWVTVTCAALFMPDAAATTVRDLPGALTFLSNWWFVFHKVPYFEAMGRPPLFRHTWSLALEFQFYLVWPILVGFAFRKFGRMGIRWLALSCAAISVALLAAATGDDTSRAYFGTDTHSMGIFLGAALATIRGFTESRKRFDALGLAALVGLFALFHFVNETIASYRYGIPLASLFSMALIAVASLPGGLVARGLATAPLRWIGTRSYSIYIWHWPVFQATRPGIDATANTGLNFLLRLTLTAIIAELSWRFIEMPMRTGVLRRVRGMGTHWNPRVYRLAVGSLLASALVAGVLETRLIRQTLATEKPPVEIVPLPPPALVVVPKPPGPNDTERATILKTPTMLLGDSVLLGVSQWLAQQINIVRVDASVGLQANELRKRAEALVASDTLVPVMIINLGNNGTITEPTFRAIMDSLKPCRRVIVVNAHVPRQWQDEGDDLIAKVIADYPNATLADWRAASGGHPEYFGSDGVHANVAGAKAYTELVVSALTRTPLLNQARMPFTTSPEIPVSRASRP